MKARIEQLEELLTLVRQAKKAAEEAGLGIVHGDFSKLQEGVLITNRVYQMVDIIDGKNPEVPAPDGFC